MNEPRSNKVELLHLNSSLASANEKCIPLSAPQTATAGRVPEWDTEPPAAAAAAGQGRHCVPLNVSQCAAGSRREDAHLLPCTR